MKNLTKLSYVTALSILLMSVTACTKPNDPVPETGQTTCSSSTPALDCDAACLRDDGSIDYDLTCKQDGDDCACASLNHPCVSAEAPACDGACLLPDGSNDPTLGCEPRGEGCSCYQLPQ